MRRFLHTIEGTGFFDRFDVGAFEREMRKVFARPDDYFSIGDDDQGASQILRRLLVIENDQTTEYEHGEDSAFFSRLGEPQWMGVRIQLGHGRRTRNMGWIVPPTPEDERLDMAINLEEGSVEIRCRFKDMRVSRQFAEDFHSALGLSVRPVKHSRVISKDLETQLLCDSMHMCNVCRDEGVIIHHIKAVEDGGRTIEENLVVLCLKHHRQAHSKSDLSKNLTSGHLIEYKRRHHTWVASRGTGEAVSDADAWPTN